jgi:hypothetical protein
MSQPRTGFGGIHQSVKPLSTFDPGWHSLKAEGKLNFTPLSEANFDSGA